MFCVFSVVCHTSLDCCPLTLKSPYGITVRREICDSVALNQPQPMIAFVNLSSTQKPALLPAGKHMPRQGSRPLTCVRQARCEADLSYNGSLKCTPTATIMGCFVMTLWRTGRINKGLHATHASLTHNDPFFR